MSKICNSCGIEFDWPSYDCNICNKSYHDSMCLVKHINETKNHTNLLCQHYRTFKEQGIQCPNPVKWIILVSEDGSQSWSQYCQDHKAQEEAWTINTKDVVKHKRSIYFLPIEILDNAEELN